jgi:hypothetical protein
MERLAAYSVITAVPSLLGMIATYVPGKRGGEFLSFSVNIQVKSALDILPWEPLFLGGGD